MTSLGTNVFFGCSALTSITIPNHLGDFIHANGSLSGSSLASLDAIITTCPYLLGDTLVTYYLTGTASPSCPISAFPTYAPTRPPQQPTPTNPPQQPSPTYPPQQPTPTSPPQLPTPTNPPQQWAPTNPPQQWAPTNPPHQLTPINLPQQLTPTNPPQQWASTNPPQQPTPTNPPQQWAPTNPPQQWAPGYMHPTTLNCHNYYSLKVSAVKGSQVEFDGYLTIDTATNLITGVYNNYRMSNSNLLAKLITYPGHIYHPVLNDDGTVVRYGSGDIGELSFDTQLKHSAPYFTYAGLLYLTCEEDRPQTLINLNYDGEASAYYINSGSVQVNVDLVSYCPTVPVTVPTNTPQYWASTTKAANTPPDKSLTKR